MVPVNPRIAPILAASEDRLANLAPVARELADLVRAEQIGSIERLARQSGRDPKTIRTHLARINKVLSIEPGLAQRFIANGAEDVADVHSAWLKTKDGDSTYVHFGKPPGAEENDEAATLDRIREAMSGVPVIPTMRAPTYSNENLLTIYPLADAHVGMVAWGRETGEDYDTNLAVQRITDWVGRCVAASPPSGTAVILDVGDLMHADDQTNQTPRSRHVLDVDTRYYRTVEVTIAALVTSVETALTRHQQVLVRILPGNHNPHSYMAILFALAERYRENPRVEVQKVPGEFFVHQFGLNMLSAHHGDKAKAERMVLFLADNYPEIWGATKHRFLFTGHLHHHKSADIGGVTWEQLRAITARDAYAVSHAYTARAQLQAITLHAERGEVQRVKVGM